MHTLNQNLLAINQWIAKVSSFNTRSTTSIAATQVYAHKDLSAWGCRVQLPSWLEAVFCIFGRISLRFQKIFPSSSKAIDKSLSSHCTAIFADFMCTWNTCEFTRIASPFSSESASLPSLIFFPSSARRRMMGHFFFKHRFSWSQQCDKSKLSTLLNTAQARSNHDSPRNSLNSLTLNVFRFLLAGNSLPSRRENPCALEFQNPIGACGEKLESEFTFWRNRLFRCRSLCTTEMDSIFPPTINSPPGLRAMESLYPLAGVQGSIARVCSKNTPVYGFLAKHQPFAGTVA